MWRSNEKRAIISWLGAIDLMLLFESCVLQNPEMGKIEIVAMLAWHASNNLNCNLQLTSGIIVYLSCCNCNLFRPPKKKLNVQ
jgi:hypothetical protein